MVFNVIILTIVVLIFIYSWTKHSYWSSRGVYSPPCYPIIGHFIDFFLPHRTYLWQKHDKFYREGKQYKFIGFYNFFSPRIWFVDPELIKTVTVKDFDHFMDKRRIRTGHPKDKIAEDFIINASRDRWKAIRNSVTPTFTSGKLKGMFPLIDKETDNLLVECDKLVEKGKAVDLGDYGNKWGLNIVESCVFGIEGDAFTNSGLVNLINDVLTVTPKDIIKYLLLMMFPYAFRKFGMYMTTEPIFEMEEFVRNTIRKRKQMGIRRGDFIDLMLEASKEEDRSNKIIDEDIIISLSIVFFTAGLTVTDMAGWIFYCLAMYKEEQEKVRQDIIDAVGEEYNYQNLQKATYLTAFINETLRVYPSGYMAERRCTKDYLIPGTNCVVPTDMLVTIPIYSLHHDEEYWPNPEKFDPMRFYEENIEKIKPYTFMPFGEGPRNCIGMRFGMLQLRIVITKMLMKYDINLVPGFEAKEKLDPIGIKPDENGVQVFLTPILNK